MISEKSPVHLRTRNMKGGGKSLYLDIYCDGRRTYEFLKLYLVEEVDAESRKKNRHTLELAETIRAQKILDVQSGMFGMVQPSMRKVRIQEFANEVLEGKDHKYVVTTQRAVRRFVEYTGNMMISKITPSILEGFINHLSNLKDSRPHNQDNAFLLSRASVLNTYSRISYLVNLAARKGIIAQSPTMRVDRRIRHGNEPRERAYLTLEELERFGQVQCKYSIVRDAFMFSCFTGLRISDIDTLLWGEIVDDQVVKRQVKTGRTVYVPLSNNAKKWLPRQSNKKACDLVFEMPSRKTIDLAVRRIAMKAGIDKDITFHCSRHTFATLTLTYGADIYTVSKLLGHSSIAVTSIYARVVDKKKREAVNLIPTI